MIRAVAVLMAALAFAACDRSEDGAYPGYVEGDYVYASAEVAGRLAELGPRLGERVEAGQILFRIDSSEATARLAAAEAGLARARAELADLGYGRRPEELAVLAAQREEAEAGLRFATAELDRARSLHARAAATASALDQAQAAVDRSTAEIARIEAQLRADRLAARPERIAAAEASIAAAEAQVAEARAALDRHVGRAPRAGRVTLLLREAGEIAAAAAPVIQILPEDGTIVRFFVPQADLSRLAVGGEVAVECDGCPPGLRARIRFVDDAARFTPPVIYSREERARLVFLVEATPLDTTGRLHAGQPVTVRLAGPGR